MVDARPRRGALAGGPRRHLPARLAAVLVMTAALAGCGEPEVQLDLPARAGGAAVADLAGVLGPEVASRLEQLREDTGYDVVAVTFESERASLGEAHRAGDLALDVWGADIALTAVAFPGHFTEDDPDARRRYFGIEADRFTVTRDLRERIVDEAVPARTAGNDWTGAFLAAVDELEGALTAGE